LSRHFDDRMEKLKQQYEMEKRQAYLRGYAKGVQSCSHDAAEKARDAGFREGLRFAAPHPCNGPLYEHWDVSQYALKCGEAMEALAEWRDEDTPEAFEHAACELTGLIVVTTSMLNKMGVNEVMRQNYIRKVNERNARRNGGKRFAH